MTHSQTITTVNGPIMPDSLGYCQCHEHLLLKKGISWERNPALCMENLPKSIQEAKDYAASGGVSLIDAQPGGCCRMEQGLKEISCTAGVHIIASTGFHKLSFYPGRHWICHISEDDMYTFILQELTRGMFCDIDDLDIIRASHNKIQSTIRAGIIKCAFDTEGLTPVYRRLFTAAARASRSTDIPMMIHIEPGSHPEVLLPYLLDLGVQPERILLCHLDRRILPTEEYLSFLREGVYLEFDTIGRFKYHDDHSEIACIRALAEKGYLDHILLSLDTTRERLRSYHPSGVGLDYILKKFIPELQSSGFSEEDIKQMTVINCKNIFVG